MKTITVLNLKGGVGRSTVATNLAGALAKSATTVLVDADLPQGTGRSWWALRAQAGKASGLELAEAATAPVLVDAVAQAQGRGVAYCVIDTPPRLAALARASLLLSDLVLIPVAASAGEIWACSDVVDLLKEANQVRAVDARLLWNRHRKNTKVAQEISEEAEKVLGVSALKSSLGMRVAYVEALGLGLTVSEMKGDSVAREEISSLVDEVKKLVKEK
jgi:chromosome partitioning protein